jgi:hypothetical protein
MRDLDSAIHLTRTRVLAGALTLVFLCAGASYAAAQAGEGTVPPYQSAYPDVRQADADLVDATVGAGCMSGFPDGTFRPGRSANRLSQTRAVNACATRIDRMEVTETLGPQDRLLGTLTLAQGGRSPGSGSWISLIASIEVRTTHVPADPCLVRVRLLKGDATSNNVLEELFIDLQLPARPSIARANGTIVDGDAIRDDPAVPFPDALSDYTLVARTQPGCGTEVEAEASLLGTVAPFNGRGTPNGAPAPSSP